MQKTCHEVFPYLRLDAINLSTFALNKLTSILIQDIQATELSNKLEQQLYKFNF